MKGTLVGIGIGIWNTSGFFEYELYVVFGLLLGMERTISVVVLVSRR